MFNFLLIVIYLYMFAFCGALVSANMSDFIGFLHPILTNFFLVIFPVGTANTIATLLMIPTIGLLYALCLVFPLCLLLDVIKFFCPLTRIFCSFGKKSSNRC